MSALFIKVINWKILFNNTYDEKTSANECFLGSFIERLSLSRGNAVKLLINRCCLSVFVCSRGILRNNKTNEHEEEKAESSNL